MGQRTDSNICCNVHKRECSEAKHASDLVGAIEPLSILLPIPKHLIDKRKRKKKTPISSLSVQIFNFNSLNPKKPRPRHTPVRHAYALVHFLCFIIFFFLCLIAVSNVNLQELAIENGDPSRYSSIGGHQYIVCIGLSRGLCSDTASTVQRQSLLSQMVPQGDQRKPHEFWGFGQKILQLGRQNLHQVSQLDAGGIADA